MRWALAGLLAVGGLITLLGLGWGNLGRSGSLSVLGSAAEEGPWQLRELNFLKAAYDRLQQDMARQMESSASLHAERERVVRQMAETAKLLPVEAVPAELRELVPEPEAVPSSPSRPIEAPLVETAAAEGRPPDLRVGLRLIPGGEPSPIGHAAEFEIDPELREPVRHEPPAERVERTPRRKPRGDAGRDQR